MRRILSMLTATLVTAVTILVTFGSPAQAAISCQTSISDWKGYGEILTYYPTTLHGGSAHLYSGRSTGAAYGRIYIAHPGSYVEIQRSVHQISTTYPTTTQVLNSGGYEYCSYRFDFTGWVLTDYVYGYKHAVRPCVRWAGSTACPSRWYSDQDM